ncbi:MAG: substrate-binding domain-containing protein [Rhodopirellula sp.]|nr:substrate-binding domain-containing protein [Rhodopirellula sp.]
MKSRDGSQLAILATLLCLGLLAALSWNGGAKQDALIVYCSHDSVYSEEILRDFERESGIRVIVRFDTEATKSIGLINLLIAEREHPQCDVFWNNEILGTMKLQKLGLLQRYQGSGFSRIPEAFKSDDGSWAGFAARLRVFIVNTERMAATPEAVEQRLAGELSNDLSRVAMAKPLFGTTLTQYAALWHELGGDALQRQHRSQRKRGLLEVNGNSVVKDLVASGRCDFGWTDTDDFFLAVDDQQPVEMLPVMTPSGKTICIPNSVAIIKGTKRLAAAQRLVDYLLSAAVETRLANSRSRQIPLGPINEDELPDDVQRLRPWAANGGDLKLLGDAHADCLKWLQTEYLQ